MKDGLDWNLIKRAAGQLGVRPKAVEKWRGTNRGVPYRWWLPIMRVTNGKITLEALEASRGEK
jgi:DNA-binding transcriptional regulator YdaS (Cro superfamily)